MTDQHTPGPWTFELDHSNSNLGGYRISSAEGHQSDFVDVRGSRSEANARLIAAAPLMLSTLKMVEFSPDGYCPWCEENKSHLPDCQIDAAIRAATGEDA